LHSSKHFLNVNCNIPYKINLHTNNYKSNPIYRYLYSFPVKSYIINPKIVLSKVQLKNSSSKNKDNMQNESLRISKPRNSSKLNSPIFKRKYSKDPKASTILSQCKSDLRNKLIPEISRWDINNCGI